MQVELKVSDCVKVVVNGETQRAVFENLASMQEVFGETECGKCRGGNFRFVVRDVDDNKYYELHCANSKCRAKLSYGCTKKGEALFPKRFEGEPDASGKKKVVGTWGWKIWNKDTQKEE